MGGNGDRGGRTDEGEQRKEKDNWGGGVELM